MLTHLAHHRPIRRMSTSWLHPVCSITIKFLTILSKLEHTFSRQESTVPPFLAKLCVTSLVTAPKTSFLWDSIQHQCTEQLSFLHHCYSRKTNPFWWRPVAFQLSYNNIQSKYSPDTVGDKKRPSSLVWAAYTCFFPDQPVYIVHSVSQLTLAARKTQSQICLTPNCLSHMACLSMLHISYISHFLCFYVIYFPSLTS